MCLGASAFIALTLLPISIVRIVFSLELVSNAGESCTMVPLLRKRVVSKISSFSLEEIRTSTTGLLGAYDQAQSVQDSCSYECAAVEKACFQVDLKGAEFSVQVQEVQQDDGMW